MTWVADHPRVDVDPSRGAIAGDREIQMLFRNFQLSKPIENPVQPHKIYHQLQDWDYYTPEESSSAGELCACAPAPCDTSTNRMAASTSESETRRYCCTKASTDRNLASKLRLIDSRASLLASRGPGNPSGPDPGSGSIPYAPPFTPLPPNRPKLPILAS